MSKKKQVVARYGKCPKCGKLTMPDSRPNLEMCPDCMEKAGIYDSTEDTEKHRDRVGEFLYYLAGALCARAEMHDLCKLHPPEKAIFDEMIPKLKESTFGSDEYKDFLKEMKVALDHHYAKSPHHPEHFEDSIMGMTCIDLIEMLADWKAASERHADGDIEESMKKNEKRFNIPAPLMRILRNTLTAMLTIDEKPEPELKGKENG